MRCITGCYEMMKLNLRSSFLRKGERNKNGRDGKIKGFVAALDWA
jgi:hypothetical protein